MENNAQYQFNDKVEKIEALLARLSANDFATKNPNLGAVSTVARYAEKLQAIRDMVFREGEFA